MGPALAIGPLLLVSLDSVWHESFVFPPFLPIRYLIEGGGLDNLAPVLEDFGHPRPLLVCFRLGVLLSFQRWSLGKP